MVLTNKNVLVIGLAVTGVPLVKVLLYMGAKVTVNDLKKEKELSDSLKELDGLQVQYILGKHVEDPQLLSNLNLVVVSPGVPLDLPFIQSIRNMGIELIGEIELAYRLSKGSIVAITGTNGKTTTTALTGEIFKHGGKNTFVCGNIGVPAVSMALETKNEDVMVMEVSSFQLESIETFRPKVAAFLNITPDHLNRHKTMENYISAKTRIFKNQKKDDFAILNYDDPVCRELSKKIKSTIIFFSREKILGQGVYVQDDMIYISFKNSKYQVIPIHKIKMPGGHNLENALAATALSFIMGISIESIQYTLEHFQGVEHRIEYVDSIEGIRFINDSKATNIDAALKAIEAVEAPIILLAGGLDKGSVFESLIQGFNGKVKHLFVYGETSKKIEQSAKDLAFFSVTSAKDLKEAINKAYDIAEKGDTILLSPACASWDTYKNFEERGRHFKNIVREFRRC